jgi:hypothetical protein
MSRRGKQGPFPWKIHPIWRGIGFLFIVIIPVISLGLADSILPLLEEPLPEYLTQTVSFPWLGGVENFYARGILTLVLSIALFLLISILGSIVYSMFGGHRNEELARFTKKYPRDR